MSDRNINYLHNPRQEIIEFIPSEARKVLDVGCNTGGFGEALKSKREVEVWGIEPRKEAAEKASLPLDHVINALFDENLKVPTKDFDVVVFNDVLEHMPDPWQALSIARDLLKEGGCIVASLPNVRHIENLYHLIVEEDFKYEKWGVRDKTHLRFFTEKSAVRMFDESGFEVESVSWINEKWWNKTILKRLLFRVFNRKLKNTKYLQFVVVALPKETI